jgi:hypothetical protein
MPNRNPHPRTSKVIAIPTELFWRSYELQTVRTFNLSGEFKFSSMWDCVTTVHMLAGLGDGWLAGVPLFVHRHSVRWSRVLQ